MHKRTSSRRRHSRSRLRAPRKKSSSPLSEVFLCRSSSLINRFAFCSFRNRTRSIFRPSHGTTASRTFRSGYAYASCYVFRDLQYLYSFLFLVSLIVSIIYIWVAKQPINIFFWGHDTSRVCLDRQTGHKQVRNTCCAETFHKFLAPFPVGNACFFSC